MFDWFGGSSFGGSLSGCLGGFPVEFYLEDSGDEWGFDDRRLNAGVGEAKQANGTGRESNGDAESGTQQGICPGLALVASGGVLAGAGPASAPGAETPEKRGGGLRSLTSRGTQKPPMQDRDRAMECIID
jgi:hypothetical protein